MNKPFLVFAAPRTGSSVLMIIIKAYLEEDQISITDEYFDMYNSELNKGIRIKDHTFEIANRIQALDKTNISIKILSSQITDSIFDYVKHKYSIILIERNDKYDQLLSWLIAMHTNIWNTNAETIKQPEFIANMENIDRFFELQTLYEKWKNKFLENSSNPTITYYEDLNHYDNFKKIIEKINFKYDNRTIRNLPKKLYSLTEKENIIINLNEVKEYRKNFE